MDNNYLLFLGAGKWQKYGIKTAGELGIKTIAVDGNPNSEGFKYSDIPMNIDFGLLIMKVFINKTMINLF